MGMKKNFWNGVMVVAIAVILVSGVMITAGVQGWGEGLAASQPSELTAQQSAVSTATAQDKLGSVNLERGGIAYSLTAGSALRSGDIVETLDGSEIALNIGGSSIRLGQNTEVTLDLATDSTSVLLGRGELFVTADSALRFTLMGSELATDSSVFSASVHTGSGSVSVFEGTATVGTQSIGTGETISILTDGAQKSNLAIGSLNDFAIANVRKAGGTQQLCFTTAQLDELTAQRDAEMREAAQARRLAEEQETATKQRIEQQRKEKKTALGVAASASAAASSRDADGDSGDDSHSGDDDDSGKLSCSIEIRCDSILQSMDKLTAGKDQYVPSDGKILKRRTVSFRDGDTVFDILRSACREDGIQLEYSHSPVYDSYYIEGINNLYEFDCGGQSGWMYKVNGWFPNYGSSAYTPKDGDVIVWGYVCEGYESGF